MNESKFGRKRYEKRDLLKHNMELDEEKAY